MTTRTDRGSPDAARTVADVVSAAAERAGGDPALIGPWGVRTWAELDAASAAGAVRLREVAAGSTGPAPARVVLALPTGLELAAALMATFRAGLIAVPVDPDRTDIAWVAERVGATAVIGAGRVDTVIGADDVRGWWDSGADRLPNVPAAGGEAIAVLARAARQGAPVMLSHRAILAAAGAVAAAPPMALTPADRVLQVLPLYHVVGLVTAFLPAALAGAAVVVPQADGAAGRVRAAVDAVRRHRVSVLPAEPTLYRQLDRIDGFERALGTIRLMTSGSSPLDPADFTLIRAATGQAVREGYGISEAAGAVTSTLMAPIGRPGSAGLCYPGVEVRIEGGDEDQAAPGDDEAAAGHGDEHDDHGENSNGNDGAAVAGGSHSVADTPAATSGADEGSEGEDGGTDAEGDRPAGLPGSAEEPEPAGLPRSAEPTEPPEPEVAMLDGITDLVDVANPGGDVGRIAIRGRTLFSGYWPDGAGGPGEDGWFVTGDIGYLDDSGELHLVDRIGETVTVAGFTVYPREVEDVLVTHPLVADAAVVPLPGRGGETVVAALVARSGTRPTADDVTEFVKSSGLAPFKRPTDYLVVEALPRTEVGRLDRGEVRRRFAAARGISLDEDAAAHLVAPTPLRRRLPGVGRRPGGVRRGARDTDDDLF